MSVVIGIDVGGSTTKIVGFRREGEHLSMIQPLFVRASDPLTSIYGAFGKFTTENELALSDIDEVMVTGVGASYIKAPIYDLSCVTVPEFRAIGVGGLYLSGKKEAVVVSMGTGTATVYAKAGEEPHYLGGTGVGGGTILGLSRLLLKMESIEYIERLAEEGDLTNIDLRISDIMDHGGEMASEMTASNFGKVSDMASRSDIALGIHNMVFETIAMVALFAARAHGTKEIVLVGNLTTSPIAHRIFPNLGRMFDVQFAMPAQAQFGPAIGAALCSERLK